jgi:hypothetical protein
LKTDQCAGWNGKGEHIQILEQLFRFVKGGEFAIPRRSHPRIAKGQTLWSQGARIRTNHERAIQNLLDAVETYGAQSAIDRLRQEEAERATITTQLHGLESLLRAWHIQLFPGGD